MMFRGKNYWRNQSGSHTSYVWTPVFNGSGPWEVELRKLGANENGEVKIPDIFNFQLENRLESDQFVHQKAYLCFILIKVSILPPTLPSTWWVYVTTNEVWTGKRSLQLWRSSFFFSLLSISFLFHSTACCANTQRADYVKAAPTLQVSHLNRYTYIPNLQIKMHTLKTSCLLEVGEKLWNEQLHVYHPWRHSLVTPWLIFSHLWGKCSQQLKQAANCDWVLLCTQG